MQGGPATAENEAKAQPTPTRIGRRPEVERRRLAFVAAAMAVVAVGEAAGGWITGSLAMLADAGHALTDVVAVSLAFLGSWLAQKAAASPAKSFGYHRAEILAAFVNAMLLFLLATVIVIEALGRFRSGAVVDGLAAAGVATVVAILEIVGIVLLHGHQHQSLGTRSAFLHLFGDLGGTLAVISSGVMIHFFAVHWVDPVISIGIALLIVFWAFRLLSDSAHILMEGTPREIDPAHLRAAIVALDGVRDVHDLHVWTLTSGMLTATAHVVADRPDPPVSLGAEVRRVVREEFSVGHVTVQLEDPRERCEEMHD